MKRKCRKEGRLFMITEIITQILAITACLTALDWIYDKLATTAEERREIGVKLRGE